MPFRFRDDISTADVAFEAWGATLEELFIAAGTALLHTMTAAPEQVMKLQKLDIRLEHEELDLLLVAFLQELIFYKDARKLLLHADKVLIEEQGGVFYLKAVVSGERLDADRHKLLVDVKAATLHRLKLQFEDSRWRGVVVLDV
jgi:SHS2 domain-containing protein